MGIIDELIGKNCWFSAIDCWFSEGKWIASLEVQPPEVLLIVPQLVCGRKNMPLPGKLSYIHGDCHYDAESNSGLRYSSTQNWHPKRSSEQPRFPQSTLYHPQVENVFQFLLNVLCAHRQYMPCRPHASQCSEFIGNDGSRLHWIANKSALLPPTMAQMHAFFQSQKIQKDNSTHMHDQLRSRLVLGTKIEPRVFDEH